MERPVELAESQTKTGSLRGSASNSSTSAAVAAITKKSGCSNHEPSAGEESFTKRGLQDGEEVSSVATTRAGPMADSLAIDPVLTQMNSMNKMTAIALLWPIELMVSQHVAVAPLAWDLQLKKRYVPPSTTHSKLQPQTTAAEHLKPQGVQHIFLQWAR